MTSLGNQIREAREKKGMTQEELAGAVGVGKEDIAAWENDERTPKEKQLQAMGDKLGAVLLDPRSADARQKADAKLEQVKEAEFLGKKTHGSGMGNLGQSKMWLIPLAAAALLAILLFGWIQPQISNLKTEIDELRQSLSAAGEKADDFSEQTAAEMQLYRTYMTYIPIMKNNTYSDGAYSDAKGGYVFTTDNEDNSFNELLFQLRDAKTNEYLLSFGSTKREGRVSGSYIHQLPTGEYRLIFKANSTLKDEYISGTVYLVENQTYGFEYLVEKYSAKEMIVKNLLFSLAGENE